PSEAFTALREKEDPAARDSEAHSTDASPFVSDDTSPNLAPVSEEGTTDSPTMDAPTMDAPPRDSASDIETRAVDKMSLDDLATTAEPALPAAPRPAPAPIPAAIAGPAAVAAAAAAALSAPVAVAPTPPPLEDPKIPISTAPQSLPPPIIKKVSSGPSPACPQCESPMAWVDEHLRFYCKSCRMYF
ncbi:MAG: hypothetical protein H0T79_10720, partial [Deltaproteobacteria bacterium]|nr:hypothetical protein [Deltaproteobacteria bacterium]